MNKLFLLTLITSMAASAATTNKRLARYKANVGTSTTKARTATKKTKDLNSMLQLQIGQDKAGFDNQTVNGNLSGLHLAARKNFHIINGLFTTSSIGYRRLSNTQTFTNNKVNPLVVDPNTSYSTDTNMNEVYIGQTIGYHFDILRNVAIRPFAGLNIGQISTNYTVTGNGSVIGNNTATGNNSNLNLAPVIGAELNIYRNYSIFATFNRSRVELDQNAGVNNLLKNSADRLERTQNVETLTISASYNFYNLIKFSLKRA